MMHVAYNVKLINAQQAKRIYKYENIKEKLYKCNAAIWYNKTCRLRNLTPSPSYNHVSEYTICDVQLIKLLLMMN